LPENRRYGDETRWDVGRVYQRKRVDELAWRALLAARRKRWMRQYEVTKKQDGEKPMPRLRRDTV